jgi:hydroxymethylbilane synthase
VRVGTRASALALAQAGHVADALDGAHLVEITTTGDRDRAAVDKAKWVRELEVALRDGRVDAAVHSAKDVPAVLDEDLVLAGIPRREDPRDALCGAASLDDLPAGARVGTSSLRRAAMLRAQRPDLEVIGIRGNVDTRLRRLAEGDFDAIVLAVAGLRRLGRPEAITGLLDPEVFVPAAGQGTLALQCRMSDEDTVIALDALTDLATRDALAAERSAVRALEADCHSALGVHAAPGADGALRVVGWVGAPDGSHWIRDEATAEGDEVPSALGARLAERLLACGAAELLAEGRAQDAAHTAVPDEDGS